MHLWHMIEVPMTCIWTFECILKTVKTIMPLATPFAGHAKW